MCVAFVAVLVAVPLANSIGTGQSASTGASRPAQNIFQKAAEREKAARTQREEQKK